MLDTPDDNAPEDATNTTYVHDMIEVVKTGRTALNTTKSGQKVEIVEITPIHSYNGTWKKWVSETTLFKVQQ